MKKGREVSRKDDTGIILQVAICREPQSWVQLNHIQNQLPNSRIWNLFVKMQHADMLVHKR